MPHLRGAPAGPRQTVILAIARTALGLERSDMEGAPVGLLLLHPLRTLAGVTDRPHTLVELTSDVFD